MIWVLENLNPNSFSQSTPESIELSKKIYFDPKKIPQDYIWNEKIKCERMQFGVHFDIDTFISGL